MDKLIRNHCVGYDLNAILFVLSGILFFSSLPWSVYGVKHREVNNSTTVAACRITEWFVVTNRNVHTTLFCLVRIYDVKSCMFVLPFLGLCFYPVTQ